MATKYVSASNTSLPPGCTGSSIKHTLSITITSLQLIQITPKPTIARIQMWGLPAENVLEQGHSLTFNVHTSGVMFRHYLRDLKVTVLRLCDSRNNQELGSGLINWTLFLRKVEVRGSPFLEDCFQITVMVYNYKKKQIAELILEVKWAVYKNNDQSISTIRQVDQIPSQNVKSMKASLNLIPNKGKSTFLPRQSETRQRRQIIEDSEFLQNQTQEQRIVSRNQKRKPSLKPKVIEEQRPETKQNIRYPSSKYELQKAQLKLEAQQFLTLTKKNQPVSLKNDEDIVTIRISDLVILKPGTVVEYLDAYVMPKFEKSDEKDQQRNRKHLRVFPSSKDGAFNVEISAKNGDIIQIEIPKVGKATIEAKSIKQKGIVKAFIYGKTGRVGNISAAKLYESKQNIQKTVEPITKKERQKILSQNQPQLIDRDITNFPCFLLVRILEAQHNYLPEFEVALKGYLFTRPFPSFNIIPLTDVGSIFAIEIRNLNNETIDSVSITDYSKITIIEENLGCTVLKNGRLGLQNGFIRVEVLLGTMKQVNFEIARESQFRQARSPPDNIKNKSQMVKKQESEKLSDRIQAKNINKMEESSGSSKMKEELEMSNHRKHKRSNRKMYTEMLGMNERIPTEPASQYKMQQNEEEEQNQNDGVFLVQVLSRFLHALPVDKIGNLPPSSVDQFINLLHHFLTGKEEKELIDLVLDMFVDDIVEEGQPYKVQYDQFLKCLKSYHNFLELWWKMRVDILYELIRSEPDFQQKITRYSQLGTVNKEVLWKKIFSRLDNPQVKLKVDKALRLNSNVTVSSAFLIEQLKRILTNPHQVPKQLTPDIIIDLGKLIKETIESILEGAGLTAPLIPEDKVNIRIMCDTLDKINVGMSYWQALMLIEELKAWYNVDLDCNQGIVSGSVVEVWLKSVINRSKVSIGEGKKQELEQKSPANKPEIVGQLNENLSQKFSKPIQNKSMAKSQLNEEQIENIANLLRDNDNFRMGTFTSERPGSKVQGNNTNTINNLSINAAKNVGKILDDSLLGDESINESLSEDPNPPKQKQPIKYLTAVVKSIKLKEPSILPSPFRITLRTNPQAQHYFLCKSTEQILNRQVIEELQPNWQHKSKGLIIEFWRIGISQGEEEAIVLFGILLSDEIIQLGTSKKNKTVVLYGNKEIFGKVTLELSVSQQRPMELNSEKPASIFMTISPDLAHQNQWCQFTIKNQTKPFEFQSLEAKKDIKCQVKATGTYYRDVLIVTVDGVGSCTVPLQELYFKGQMSGAYPVVTEESLFVGNLEILLQSHENALASIGNTMIHKEKSKEAHIQAGLKYLIIFDSLSTLNFQALNSTSSPLSILCNIFIKDAYNRSIIYRSPFYIEHEQQSNSEFTHTRISEFSQENYCIVEEIMKEKAVTIELEYESRCIGMGTGVLKLREIVDKGGALGWYHMNYVGSVKGQIKIGLGLRVLSIPESFSRYNVNRIYKAVSKAVYPAERSQSDYLQKLLRDNPKLTISEQKLTRQLTSKPGSINAFHIFSLEQHTQLLSELVYGDSSHSGYLSKSQLQEIMANVVRQERGAILMQEFQETNWGNSKDSDNVCYLALLSRISIGEIIQKQNAWRYGATDSAIENIDRLHKQIKDKYIRP